MSYVVNGREYDEYSAKNQRIVSKFVSKEVYACVTSITEFILNVSQNCGCGLNMDAPFTWDDVENVWVNNSEEITDLSIEKDTLEEKLEELQEKLDELDEQLEEIREEYEEDPSHRELLTDINEIEEEIKDLKKEIEDMETEIEELEGKIEELEEEEQEPQEAYEWWQVTSWLCDKLKDRGEIVIDYEGIWGRQTTGQSISLDWVIIDICKSIEILEGQKYEWEV